MKSFSKGLVDELKDDIKSDLRSEIRSEARSLTKDTIDGVKDMLHPKKNVATTTTNTSGSINVQPMKERIANMQSQIGQPVQSVQPQVVQQPVQSVQPQVVQQSVQSVSMQQQVVQQPAQSVPMQQQVVQQPIQSVPMQQQSVSVKKKKSSLIFIIIIAIVLLAVGCGVYFFMNQNKINTTLNTPVINNNTNTNNNNNGSKADGSVEKVMENSKIKTIKSETYNIVTTMQKVYVEKLYDISYDDTTLDDSNIHVITIGASKYKYLCMTLNNMRNENYSVSKYYEGYIQLFISSNNEIKTYANLVHDNNYFIQGYITGYADVNVSNNPSDSVDFPSASISCPSIVTELP